MKTMRDKMQQNNENLGWCKPYTADNNKIQFAINENGICGMIVDGKDAEVNDDLIKALAQRANSDYSEYEGYDDEHILVEASREMPCHDCPFFNECEAMNEEVETANEEVVNDGYYWFETEYIADKVWESSWALHRKDEDDNDEIVLYRPWAEFEEGLGLEDWDPDSCEYEDIKSSDRFKEEVWNRVDAYIEKELGFLPEYDVN